MYDHDSQDFAGTGLPIGTSYTTSENASPLSDSSLRALGNRRRHAVRLCQNSSNISVTSDTSHLMRLRLVHACVLHGNSMDCLFRILSILCCASHSSDMPGLRWSTETSSQFWSRRSTTVIARLPRVHQRNAERIHRVAQRDAARCQRREEFVQRYRERAVPGTPSILDTEEMGDLRFWSQHQAWTYCASCGALQPQKLLPSYRRRPPMKASRTCNCRTQRYVLPNEDDTPLSLQGLTDEQIRALRPLDIHTGEYRRMQHGYRARTSSFRVTWSVTSVEEKIHNLHPASSRQAAQRAYDAVMRSPQSLS